MGNVHAVSSSASSPNIPAPPIPSVPPPAPPTPQPPPESPILAPVEAALNPGTFEDLHKQCKGKTNTHPKNSSVLLVADTVTLIIWLLRSMTICRATGR